MNTPPNPALNSSRLARYLLLVATVAPISATGADLKPETAQQWEDYVKTADARNAEHLAHGNAFLFGDEVSGHAAKLRCGGIVVGPMGPHVPLKVQSGLIHDWTGAVFIPNTKLEDVLSVLRDYDRYKEFYRPNVVDSKRIGTTDSKDRFSTVVINKSVVAKTALDFDYEVSYVRVDDHRWYSIADATRINEIAEYDTPSQHTLPENRGTGLIWRLHCIMRFEERDGGVYIEVEAIALSRDIPAAFRWAVEPIVRRVSRSSVATSLQQTKAAVRAHSTTETVGISGRTDDPAMKRTSAPTPSTSSLVRPLR